MTTTIAAHCEITPERIDDVARMLDEWAKSGRRSREPFYVGYAGLLSVGERQILEDASAALITLKSERDEARGIVANVNNSLFGSQGYFTKPDCIDAIENLKAQARHDNAVLRECLKRCAEALTPHDVEVAAWNAKRVLMMGPK